MVKTSAQPYKHIIHAYVYNTYTMQWRGPHTATQDSDNKVRQMEYRQPETDGAKCC